MQIGVGLVIKGNEQFIYEWLNSAEKIGNMIFVIDNGISDEARQKIINHRLVKHYYIQKNMGRNMSRDYQKLLDMMREENIDWAVNLDSDEIIPETNKEFLMGMLLNTKDESIGFPLFEMRNDDKHYVMINDMDGTLKDARLCHKCYKVLSHFKFNKKDKHGVSIPHNCKPGQVLPIVIQHYGHYTKELREEKRKAYGKNTFKDFCEHTNSWLEEDESKITIKKWEDNPIFKR